MTANLSITSKKIRGKSIPRDSPSEADPQDRRRFVELRKFDPPLWHAP